LFVLVRVISWIACYAPRKVIHEITRTNLTNRTNQAITPGICEQIKCRQILDRFELISNRKPDPNPLMNRQGAKNAKDYPQITQRGFQQQPMERSTKIHEITLTRKFVFVRVISWIVFSCSKNKNLQVCFTDSIRKQLT